MYDHWSSCHQIWWRGAANQFNQFLIDQLHCGHEGVITCERQGKTEMKIYCKNSIIRIHSVTPKKRDEKDKSLWRTFTYREGLSGYLALTKVLDKGNFFSWMTSLIPYCLFIFKENRFARRPSLICTERGMCEASDALCITCHALCIVHLALCIVNCARQVMR